MDGVMDTNRPHAVFICPRLPCYTGLAERGETCSSIINAPKQKALKEVSNDQSMIKAIQIMKLKGKTMVGECSVWNLLLKKCPKRLKIIRYNHVIINQ